MRWPRSFLVYCLSFMVLLLGVFFTSFLTVNNVSAVSPLTVSYSAGQTLSSDPMFPDCDKSCYENYNYLSVHVDNPNYSNMEGVNLFMTRKSNDYLYGFRIAGYLDAFYDISSFYNLRYEGSWGKSPTDITFTLLDSLPAGDCPVCEECQVCPAIPENPYDDKFDKIITAIYVCAATILVVYFFYCIYRMIIKSAGSV